MRRPLPRGTRPRARLHSPPPTAKPAQHLLGIASDRKWIRYARTHLIDMFPALPQQSGWGKRVRHATGLLSAVITELARDTSFWTENIRLLDSTPVRCGKSRETVKRSDLAGIRQWVESAFDTKKGQLTLEDHGGRTIPGVYSHIAARLLTLAAESWYNWLIGAPIKRSLIAHDHEDSLI